MSPVTTALSDAEMAELDDFLLSDSCDEEVLSVDEVHGFLTAMLTGPRQLAQPEWLAMVWGEPQFTDGQQAERMRGLMGRLYNDVEATLRGGRDFEPLAVEIEEEDGTVIVAYEGWCFGFMLGVELAEEEWGQLPKEGGDLLAPMAQLALLNSEEEPEMDEEEYEQWVELLPGAVMGLYSMWHHQ